MNLTVTMMKTVMAIDLLSSLLLLLFGFSHGFISSNFVPNTPCRSFALRRWGRLSGSSDDDNEMSQFEEQLRKLRENVNSISLPTIGRPPNKADIYAASELEGLWQIHQQLSSDAPKFDPDRRAVDASSPVDEVSGISSIHDLVMKAVGEMDSSTRKTKDSSYPWFTDDIDQRSKQITAVASDVDGTILGRDQKVHPRTKAAIEKAVEAAFSPKSSIKWFFLATGKSRTGAMNSLGPELSALLMSCPGVYIQGLYCVIGNTVIFEQKLEKQAVKACEELVLETKTSIIAYDGDTLYTTNLTESVIRLHELYGEPLSKEISSISALSGGVHKILLCDDDVDKLTNIVRPQLEILAAANNATVTQAVPTMLELLPGGCSKGLGVEKLCEKLGIDPTVDLLAMGDAENDIEMLQMAAIGVVMGNGSPGARNAGDIVLDETSGEGGVGLAMEVLLGDRL